MCVSRHLCQQIDFVENWVCLPVPFWCKGPLAMPIPSFYSAHAVQALAAALKDTPALTALALDLSCNDIGDSGAQALAMLRDSPTLTTVTVDLTGNEIGSEGAQALVALADAPSLTALTLNLWGNQIADSGAHALAALRHAPSLTALSLHLCHNEIRDGGAQALSALKDAPALTALELDLIGNRIGHHGAQALATLKQPPQFTVLNLKVDDRPPRVPTMVDLHPPPIMAGTVRTSNSRQVTSGQNGRPVSHGPLEASNAATSSGHCNKRPT